MFKTCNNSAADQSATEWRGMVYMLLNARPGQRRAMLHAMLPRLRECCEACRGAEDAQAAYTAKLALLRAIADSALDQRLARRADALCKSYLRRVRG